MIRESAGNLVEFPLRADRKYLEHQDCETTKDIYQTIHNSGVGKLTSSLVDSMCKDLNAILRHLERSPEIIFKELMEVVEGLRDARNELRHARFLFDVEEINPVYRLLMRNRAVLRGEHILQKTLQIWPLHSSTLVEPESR